LLQSIPPRTPAAEKNPDQGGETKALTGWTNFLRRKRGQVRHVDFPRRPRLRLNESVTSVNGLFSCADAGAGGAVEDEQRKGRIVLLRRIFQMKKSF